MNNSAKKWLWALVAVLSVILIALAVLLVNVLRPEAGSAHVSEGFSSANEAAESAAEPTPTAEPAIDMSTVTVVSEDSMEIETPYCVLYYPQVWEDYVRVEQSGEEVYTVLFRAVLPSENTQELFSVVFGGTGESALGLMTTESGDSVPVSIEKYDFAPDDTWSSSDISIVKAMLEDVNRLRAALPALEPAVAEESFVLPENDGTLMTVETPWAALSYPACWEEYLATAVDEAARNVTFYGEVGEHEAVELFAVCFGGEEGTPAGTVSTPEGELDVLVQMGEHPFDDSWSEDEKNTIYAMREGINDLLAMLN